MGDRARERADPPARAHPRRPWVDFVYDLGALSGLYLTLVILGMSLRESGVRHAPLYLGLSGVLLLAAALGLHRLWRDPAWRGYPLEALRIGVLALPWFVLCGLLALLGVSALGHPAWLLIPWPWACALTAAGAAFVGTAVARLATHRPTSAGS